MASPNVQWRVRHRGPIQPLPDNSTPVPRASKPHITPIGWACSIPRTGLKETEKKYYILAKTIEEKVHLPYGVQDVSQAPPLEDDRFLEAIWPLVVKGLAKGSGIQTMATSDALKQAPMRMRFGERTLDPYQMQDIGQLARIEREMGTAFMLHAMGLGKTLQALAICEHNNDISEEPRGPTLIVVPPDAILDQWLEEIAKAIPHAKVWDYRNQNDQAKTVEELAQYDYVVASIYTVSKDYEANCIFIMDQRCRERGETRRNLSLTPKQIRQAELTGKKAKPKTVALTTGIPQGYLHTVFWNRVVLDEAHRLRRNGSRSMCAPNETNSHSDWNATTK